MADTNPTAASVPIEKFTDFEMDVGGGIGANSIAKMLPVTPDFEAVGTTYKPKKRQRMPQHPHTPSESPRHFAAAG